MKAFPRIIPVEPPIVNINKKRSPTKMKLMPEKSSKDMIPEEINPMNTNDPKNEFQKDCKSLA